MHKVLGLDLGSKNTGLAISDSLQTIAFPYKTIATEQLATLLPSIIENEAIHLIVIGENLYPNKHFPIRKIAQQILSDIQIKYTFINEDYSTQEAKNLYQKLPSKNKAPFASIKDELAAQIILQNFLDKNGSRSGT